MSISFKEFIEDHPNDHKVRLGDMINATVVDINFKKKLVLVDGGPDFKSESLVSLDEFIEDERFSENNESESVDKPIADNQEGIAGQVSLAVGDTVSVVVEALDNGYGETVLSREKAKRETAWSVLQEALDNKTTVQGIVTGKVRGGFTVDIGVLKGFLPGSLVDVNYIEEINALTQKKFDFKVITLDYQRNNIVLSQGQVSRDALLKNLKEGQIVKGYIKNLVDYGAFINLGGIDGLLHNFDIAWKKTTAIEEFKSRDPKEPIEVIIREIVEKQGRPRIALGLKQLSQDPWVNLADRYSVGMRLEKRKVTHIKEYGCFVEIEPGVEGLVHTSEMDWTSRNPNPHTLIQKIQDEEGRIDVVIVGIEVDLEANKRRLSLSIKRCMENPWVSFSDRYQEGDAIQGKIRSITDLGLFINLEGNIDGLIHHSEISDDVSGEAATRQFSKGDIVQAKILSIDSVKERIALSIRQLDSSNQPVLEEMTINEEENEIHHSTAIEEIADELLSDETVDATEETLFDESTNKDTEQADVLTVEETDLAGIEQNSTEGESETHEEIDEGGKDHR